MTSTNPYHPPQAAIADVSDAHGGTFQEMKIWSWRGRLGRLRLLAYGSVAYLVCMVPAVAFAVTAGNSGATGLFDAMFWMLWMLPISLLVFIVLVTIRRSHDMGWSGWMSLLALIPLVGLIWLFKAGNPGANAYGAPPPPNTTGVKFAAFGGIFGFVVLHGILAAISIADFQHYSQRAAHAAQQAPPK